jgi:7-keto-8-aminopelargonate synthetase-like enzyme
VFSTGLAPVCAAAAVRALQQVLERPELYEGVRGRSARLRAGLVAAGAVTTDGGPSPSPSPSGADDGAAPRLLGFGHIVPVVLGTPARALRWAERMRALGVHVLAIRPPTVPTGAARIRLTVTAQHTDADVDRAVAAFAAALREEGAT